MTWWMRPLVRLVAAVLLPLVVPAIITGALWALPGDPANIICPPETCDGTAALAARWNLDQGPLHFYLDWMSKAVTLDMGRSWTLMAGSPVYDEMVRSVPNTALLVLWATIPLFLGTLDAALGLLPRRVDLLWQAIGLLPAVILALLVAAYVEITFGAFGGDEALRWKLLLGGLVLGLADGALAGAVTGTRTTFEEEVKQRYVQIAMLRGESVFANAMPNVLPALIGQMRGRLLHVLSGAVVVEVVVGIPGLGELLWAGTLKQDFGVVLAATFAFSAFSGALMLFQGLSEIAVAWYVHRSPAGVVEAR
ncbi:MAG: ABC transporter permease subunit [Alphaproteobacteria bacterium]|nr:ABC transporter permease subunit [Alphaproteobacteria bacterium]